LIKYRHHDPAGIARRINGSGGRESILAVNPEKNALYVMAEERNVLFE